MTDQAPDVPLGHLYDIDRIISCIWASGGGTKGQAVKITATASTSLPTEPTVGPTSATGDKALGVALKTGATGDNVPVLYHGVTKVTAGGAITAGSAVKGTSTGQVIAAVNTLPTGTVTVTSSAGTPTVESGVSCGIALDTSSGSGDLIAAIIDGSR